MNSSVRSFLLQGCLLLFGVNGSAFEINRVILSSDANPKYLDFWPVVAPIWKAMGIKPTLALVAEDDVEVDTTLGDVIRFKPLKGAPPGLYPQVIRLALPALFPEDVSLISDIDMIPVSKEYFTQNALRCPENGFLVYRDKGHGEGASCYALCYVAAKGSVFGSMFHINRKEDILPFVQWVCDLQLGWFSDQIVLTYCANEWRGRGGNLVLLGHTVEKRCDREAWDRIDFEAFDPHSYIDCHCPRPYADYKKQIDAVSAKVRASLQDGSP